MYIAIGIDCGDVYLPRIKTRPVLTKLVFVEFNYLLLSVLNIKVQAKLLAYMYTCTI